MNHFIELRTLTLKPNSRDQFHRLHIEEALPRLQRWNFDVMALHSSPYKIKTGLRQSLVS